MTRISTLSTRIESNRWIQFVVQFTSEKGQFLAALVLVLSCGLMLMSDWPGWWPQVPKSVQVLIQPLTQSYTKGRHFMFDRYQHEAPRSVQSQPVTIVAIDEKSLARWGQWPWPRHKLATLIDTIGKHEPAAIGLDMYMPEVDQTSPGQVALTLETSQPALAQQLKALPSNDEFLSKSLQRTPSVLGAAGFDFKTYTTSEGLRTWPLNLQGGDHMPSAARDYPAVLASLPMLQSAASGQALLSVDSEQGAVRRMPLVASVAGQPVPSLALEMFRVAMGESSSQIRLDSHGIDSVNVGDLRIPTQPNGDVFVHFSPQSETLQRYVSALDVLENKVDPEALSGKLVLIGLTGMGLNDMRTTALGELVPGIEIQAQLIESIFDQRFLLRPWWMVLTEVCCALLVGGLMIWLLPRLSPSNRMGVIYRLPKVGLIVSLGINAVAVGAGFYIFRTHGLLFDAASFFLVTSAVFGMIFAFVKACAAKAQKELKEKEWAELVQRAEQAEAALQHHSRANWKPA